MPRGEYYIVYIQTNPDVSAERLTAAMNLAIDWFRIDQSIWILFTTADKVILNARFEKLVKPHGALFICKLDIKTRNGFIDKRLWEWIKSRPLP